MKTLTLNTCDFVKAQSSEKEIWKGTLSKKIGKLFEHMMSVAVVLLMVTVIVVAFMKIEESGTINAQYCDATTKVVCAPQ